MNMLSAFILIFTSSAAVASRQCTDVEFTKNASRGLPAGAQAIMSRIVICSHMGGETGDTDPERTKQINAALEKEKCKTLAQDQADFINRYPKMKKMKDAFLKAENWDEKSCE